MADKAAGEFPVWHTPEGEPVSCIEKIKVLNENLAELRDLAQDALEDAVLMGCDERQGRGEGAAVQRLDVLVEPGLVGARARGLRRQPARLQTGERVAAAARSSGAGRSSISARQVARKHTAVTQRLGKQAVIAGAGDLDRAELRQMRRQELGIEQSVAAEPQGRHEMDERHLAGGGNPAEHALAEEGGAERHAVEAADELALMPAFDAVRRAALEH